MIRMDDAASIMSSDYWSSHSIIPQKLKFWKQMIPCAGKNFMFSTRWKRLRDEPDPLEVTLGNIGNWHVVVVILMMVFNIPTVFHAASPEVTTTGHDFWCHKLAQNLTIEQWRLLSSVKRVNFRGQEVVDPCYIKDLPYETAPYEDLIYMDSPGYLPCNSWDFNSSRVSVVSQFYLACTRLPVNNVAESVLSIGAAFGGLISGYLSDRVGRRKVLMLGQGILVVLGFLNAHAASYGAYLFNRTLIGAACSAVALCSFLLCIEISCSRWQDTLSTLYMFSYSLAYMILHLTNSNFDRWVHLQYSITLIAVVLLSIWWLVPESPRWLLTSQDIPRFMVVLEMASSFNRRALPPGTSTIMKNLPPVVVEYKKPTMMMLFRGPAIQRLSILVPFISFFSNVTYFGLVLNQDLFNYGLFISGAVEFVAGSVVLMLGIKDDVKMVMIANALSGLSCIIGAFFMQSVYLDIACMSARFFGGMMNSCLTTTVATMYPTLFRTMGLGWYNFFYNMALAVAANIVLLSDLSFYLPLIILGCSGFLGSFFMLFLPGRVSRCLLDLPEQVEYGHEMISRQRKEDPQAGLIPPHWTPPAESLGTDKEVAVDAKPSIIEALSVGAKTPPGKLN